MAVQRQRDSLPSLVLKSSSDFDPGKKEVYVLCISEANQKIDGNIAVSGSNNCINVYANRGSGLDLVNQICSPNGFEGVVSGLHWTDRQLCSASTDGKIRLWDPRKSEKTPANAFQGYNHEPFNCVSANDDGYLLAAGTDLVGDDASIYIWDIRMGRDSIGQFTESHSNDIVEVWFSPDSSLCLASGSTDGLVCLFDLHSMEEEEAIMSVKNSEASVSKVGFSGSNSEYVYCLTHEEGCVVWERSEVEPLSVQKDVKKTVEEKYGVAIDYLVDFYYQSSSDKLVLIAGDTSGGLRLFHSKDSKDLVSASLLTGGHSATVRAISWNQHVDKDTLITGGEDGLVCLWTT